MAKQRAGERGAAAVEFALILPILLTLVFGIVEFGWAFGQQVSLGNAAREAARTMAIHWADLYWQAVPALHPEGFTIGVLDVAVPVAIGGLWLAWFAWQLGSRPVLAYNDPYLVKLPFHDTPEEEAMSHG